MDQWFFLLLYDTLVYAAVLQTDQKAVLAQNLNTINRNKSISMDLKQEVETSRKPIYKANYQESALSGRLSPAASGAHAASPRRARSATAAVLDTAARRSSNPAGHGALP